LNNKYIPIIIQLIGSSLKIIQSAIWDELHIFLTSLNKIPKIQISLSLWFLLFWQGYLVVWGFAQGYGFSMTYYRYVLVFLSLFFLVTYYRKLINIDSSFIFTFVGFCYLIIYLLICYCGDLLNLRDAWWQDWLWAGTAYVGYIVYIIVSLVFILNDNLKVRILILFLAYLTAFAASSRIALILIMFSTFFIGFGLKNKFYLKLKIKEILKYMVYSLIFLILSFNVFFKKENPVDQLGSIKNTIYDLLILKNERDSDRVQNIKSVIFLYNENIPHFIFGSGLTSHQYELVPYMTPSSDGRVRPTGFPAVVFDGGIIYFMIIIFCAISSIFKFLNFAQSKLIPLWKTILWITVIINSIFVLFVVNVTDLMLWWAVILSGTIITKKKIIDLKNLY